MKNRFLFFPKLMGICLLLFQCNILRKDKELSSHLEENKHQTNRIIIYHESGINLTNLKAKISGYGGKLVYESKQKLGRALLFLPHLPEMGL